ncbi:hypothetical protein I307_02098 [Cryptococcus deuterogattii 99/473]|uniref:DUF1748-domain-containing protein n=6 Tax=Cryptococcus gattii species complex TaxID=1884637 RepID=A0A0D0V284_9TREE|nr:hypothetical protein CNBG_0339 [Cryptococcus deuterogattii R265]KIR25607.1 hypothetical protein I309_05545 [Cryptococcus deuterogattii LA55]KIR33785.1 hypothetical protein I352_03863 [Cryptococcus deuterogattii MMRL2647]KIR40664.1 hypothetical protein I313_03319 [Cryptococcus deuterogattii Ram5]KIR50286.1 hypothetical protein I312_00218 [Cryptococcus bacillisporus CA1280]KIR67265.1 hypothetical protein I314_02479 [Cryptococcus bacillisporus CA1873]KIR74345.1 hypothetical protein I310_01951|eukprot:KIR67265.1 hypothetical protein I314_02479 [Cryptococcus gattii CA1873]
MFGFGRLGHIVFDLIAISTILAGVKKSTGYSIQTSLFTDTAIRSFIDSYLSVGETVFGMLSGYAVNSRYFKRNIE